jgi:hypothetical protein
MLQMGQKFLNPLIFVIVLIVLSLSIYLPEYTFEAKKTASINFHSNLNNPIPSPTSHSGSS